MRNIKLYRSTPLSVLGITLLLTVPMVVGAPLGVSQEEDVCASVFVFEEEWSAQAYAYCKTYCVALDCAGTPATEEEASECLALLDQYDELTGGEIPSCEVHS